MIRSSLRATFATAAILVAACNGQMLIEEEDDTPNEGWSGNAPNCPPTANEGATCDVDEGQVCVFYGPVVTGSYLNRLCGCFEASSTERRWHCYENATTPWECPREEPVSGFACSGFYGTECLYPERTLCSCPAETGVFSCTDLGRTDLEPPSSVPAERPIPALTDEERADWCDWFSTAHLIGEGFPEPAPAPPDEDGFTALRGCSVGWEFHCNALIPTISSSECEANLRLSTCEASISELTDCVSTVYDTCWPSPHGCARYLERPGCDGTIAVTNDGNLRPEEDPGGGRSEPSSCRIRVQ